MKALCTICARGGSKGVVNKNIRLLGGLPLIARSIMQAQRTARFAEIAVSSDADAILEVAAEYGATVLVKRPPALATDTAPKLPAIQHCVRTAEGRTGAQFDLIVDLDATSPLRTPSDIVGCIDMQLADPEVSNVITGCESRRSPYFNLVEDAGDGFVKLAKPPLSPIVRRQDVPRTFDMNASIYVWKRQVLFNAKTVVLPKTKLFVMPAERSVDIDSEFDFEIVEMLMARSGEA